MEELVGGNEILVGYAEEMGVDTVGMIIGVVVDDEKLPVPS